MDRVAQHMDVEQEPALTVEAIFARAERVFERRVDQLLQLKRHKARLAGTTFNARKAKRDARTVAGREKLDALVRRLADLATLQEAALGEERSKHVAATLNSSAVAVVGVAALTAQAEMVASKQGSVSENEISGGECEEDSCGMEQVRGDGQGVVEDGDGGKDVLETSSCSDDCCSVGGCLSNCKESVESEVNGKEDGFKSQDRERLFSATQSVVNFVLECDDDQTSGSVYEYEGGQSYGHEMYPICQAVTRYDPLVSGGGGEWGSRYSMQPATSL